MITGMWRKLHNEELTDLYSSPNIIRVMKSSRIRWAGHVNCNGRGEVHTGFWCRNLRERCHLEDPGVDRRIILSSIFGKWDVGAWTGLIWLMVGTGGGLL